MTQPTITLHLGDCLEFMRTMSDKSAVLVTDPPYGVNFDTDYRRFTSGHNVMRTNHKKVEGDNVAFNPEPFLVFDKTVMFGANCFSDKLPKGSWFIWDKRYDNGTAFLADGEAAWYSKGFGVYIKSVTQQGFVRPEPILHPTQKPIEIMKWIIGKVSKVGDTVFDPFMGSGTTGVACKLLRRNFIGCEISKEYYDLAKRRIDSTEWGLFA